VSCYRNDGDKVRMSDVEKGSQTYIQRRLRHEYPSFRVIHKLGIFAPIPMLLQGLERRRGTPDLDLWRCRRSRSAM
jgi:hypothetical protein